MELKISSGQRDDQTKVIALSKQFLHQWNQLVSTTNWEKGKIICRWRDVLQVEGFSPHHFSDEVWSRHIGNVTPQHAGRLRKVFVRFGSVWQDYSGLYWSHFYAALDWEDPELWLEGAIQNQWSISQMRSARSKAQEAVAQADVQDDDILLQNIHENIVFGIGSSSHVPASKTKNPSTTETSHLEDSVASSQVKLNAETTSPVSASDQTANESMWPEDLQKAFRHLEKILLKHKNATWKEVNLDSVLMKIDQMKRQIQQQT